MEENQKESKNIELDIDPMLLMEDILEKLKILDYEIWRILALKTWADFAVF